MMRRGCKKDRMQINPPFGYSEIVPLYRDRKVRLPAPGAVPDFCRKANAVPISFSEFAVACRDYPLAFVSTDAGRSFSPVAVLGMAEGENLFLRREQWERSVYLPAYVRRYPFCMARITLDSVEQTNRMICVEKAFLADDGETMFDSAGGALPRWRPIEKLLQEYEADIERASEMCAILADYALLEPFTLQASPTQGGPVSFGGMYRVNEGKLEHLTAAQHKTLIRKGLMGRIYAHLISLDNFARLLALRNAPT
jgi:SapC protein